MAYEREVDNVRIPYTEYGYLLSQKFIHLRG